MAGVYCPRCETRVNLDSDGASCSNCRGRLMGKMTYIEPEPLTNGPPGPPEGHVKKRRFAHPVVRSTGNNEGDFELSRAMLMGAGSQPSPDEIKAAHGDEEAAKRLERDAQPSGPPRVSSPSPVAAKPARKPKGR